LTGLGERRHDVGGETDLTTHINDVIAHIEMEGLQSVTLVGWSYGGMVISGAAARIPDKIKSLIYLDAFLPEDGRAVVDYFTAEQRAQFDSLVKDDLPIPPIPLEVFGVTAPEMVEFVTPRLVSHPWRTFYEPVRVLTENRDISIGYVYCSRWGGTPFTQFYEKFKGDPRVQTVVIDTGHHCMLTEPSKTIEILVSLA
jgi:pimeloyl-ACP methyl ester carboxylesterase